MLRENITVRHRDLPYESVNKTCDMGNHDKVPWMSNGLLVQSFREDQGRNMGTCHGYHSRVWDLGEGKADRAFHADRAKIPRGHTLLISPPAGPGQSMLGTVGYIISGQMSSSSTGRSFTSRRTSWQGVGR